MNPYINDFSVRNIETFILEEPQKINEVFNVNNKYQNFKLVHSNIRRIAKNVDEFIVYIEQAVNNSFDCIFLSETRQIPNIDIFKLEGYTTLYTESRLNQNEVMIFVKYDIYHSHCNIELNGPFAIKFKLLLNDDYIIIHAVYRSPARNALEFIEYLLNNNDDPYKYKIISGDFNIDLLTLRSNEYIDVLGEYSYYIARK